MVAFISDKEAYEHLKPQHGNGFFRGTLRQHGKGIGGILSSLAKTAFPILKRHILPHVGKSLLSTAGDVLTGKNIKQSIKKRSKKAGKKIVRSLLNKPPKTKRITRKKAKDIFG